MRYKLLGPRLRVCKQLALKATDNLRRCRLIVLHHLMEDTLEFVQVLEQAGATVDLVIGKHYSTNPDIYRYFDQRGVEVRHTEELEQKQSFPQLLKEVTERAAKAKQKVVILEVGGYFAPALAALPPALRTHVAGSVEDTTFGHNRYLEYESKLKVPVYSVARSPLKMYESTFVGEAVVLALQNMFRSLGVALAGARVLILGYGMISSATARVMRRANLHPVIYDIDQLKTLSAYVEGYDTILKKESLERFDMVFAATGKRALSVKDMHQLKDGVVLVSGGSQQVEFDIEGLEAQAERVQTVTDEVKQYFLKGKRIVVLRDGTPVNFRETSVPDEVMDLVFAEILLSTLELITKPNLKPGMYEVDQERRSAIAKAWLELVN